MEKPKSDVLLSVILPTKNRYKYLIPLIDKFNDYHFRKTEIVIEDNSDNNQELLSHFDSRDYNYPIIYNWTNDNRSMKENIDNSILHSTGEYICVIGDDDSVMPQIEEFVEFMKENNIESVRQKTEITYKWPTYTNEFNKGIKGACLTYPNFTQTLEKTNPKESALNAEKHLFMSLGTMPCAYQGIVKRDTLNKLYAIGKSFFPGPSPDMANAIALSHIVDNHYLVDWPIIISGGSEYQGGKTDTVKKWILPLSEVPVISQEDKNKWDRRLPYYWSVETVWPESAIKGLQYVGKDISILDIDKLLAKSLVYGIVFKDEIMSKAHSPKRVRSLYWKFLIREKIAKMKRFLVAKGIWQEKGIFKEYNIMNIDSAVSLLEQKGYAFNMQQII